MSLLSPEIMQPSENRKAFLNTLAAQIGRIEVGHPLRVAIDGVDTSGKTTLANELVDQFDRPVVRASVDSFHRPRVDRYRKGTDSAEGYYEDSFNHELLISRLLQPIAENIPFNTAVFDYKTDSQIIGKPVSVASNAVLLVDGVFLLRPELNSYWDLRIFLDVPFERVLERAKVRDRDYLGGEQEVADRYRKRYIPGQKIYLDAVHPEELADIVVDNADFNNPRIIRNKLTSNY